MQRSGFEDPDAGILTRDSGSGDARVVVLLESLVEPPLNPLISLALAILFLFFFEAKSWVGDGASEAYFTGEWARSGSCSMVAGKAIGRMGSLWFAICAA